MVSRVCVRCFIGFSCQRISAFLLSEHAGGMKLFRSFEADGRFGLDSPKGACFHIHEVFQKEIFQHVALLSQMHVYVVGSPPASWPPSPP